MKFTFRDTLKDEAWDEQDKGWYYPWLKRGWVEVRAMESGGATIPTTSYRPDPSTGFLHWLAGKPPGHISVVVSYRDSWVVWMKKYTIFILPAIVLFGGLLFWMGRSSFPPAGSACENDECIAEITALTNIKDSLQNALGTSKDSSAHAASFLRDSLARLHARLDQAGHRNDSIRNGFQRQIEVANEEIRVLRSRAPRTFRNFTATISCKPATCNSSAVQEVICILQATKIALSSRDFIPSTTTSARSIKYGNNGREVADYLFAKLNHLNLVDAIEHSPSIGSRNNIHIYID